jgi:hypothetical protein
VIGNDGASDVTTANGFQLSAGEIIILDHVADLSNVYVDAAVNGEGVCWLALDL